MTARALLLCIAFAPAACSADTFSGGDADPLGDAASDSPVTLDGAQGDADADPPADGGGGDAPITIDADASDAIVKTYRIVFISKETYSGNLGGTSGADATCNTLAHTAGYTGTFAAWISTTLSPVSTRFLHSSLPYKLVDGTTVATDWNTLVSGTLSHALDLDENGATVVFSTSSGTGIAWTGTWWDGTVDPSNDRCADWTTTDTTPSHYPLVGYDNVTNVDWTRQGRDLCNAPHSLYCFEQ